MSEVDTQALEKARELQSEIKSLLSRNSAQDALRVGINALPLKTKSQEAKDLTVAAILPAFTSIPSSGIDGFLEASSVEDRTTILKYVYACMKISDKKDSETLLVWHGKIVAKDGHGCINRAISDRDV